MRQTTLMTCVLCGLFIASCTKGGAVREPHSPNSPDDAFVEPDMEESQANLGYQEVQLSAEDERLVIPGQGMGKVPPIKKRGKKGNPNNPSFWPKTDSIANLMEGLEWGMSIKKVFSIFEAKIKENYKAQIDAASGDLLAEDRIRTAMYNELNKVKASYVAFDGQTTGYESHMVDVEFTHNNNESMMVWDAGKYVEYLFFINGRFWKRVRLFRVDKLGGLSLEEFTTSIESVMGCPGLELVTPEGEFDKTVWRDADTFAAVLDGSKFFGVYGLRLSSAVTETNLDKLRTNKDKSSGAVSDDISDTVDSAVNSVDMTDHQESVIDSYTGKTHSPKGFSEQNNTPAPKKDEKPAKNISNEDVDSLF